MTALAATVRDNEAAHRYELLVDEEAVGELIYRARDGAITLIHTEVAPQYEGHGLGDQLVAYALDDIRTRGLQIVPLCPFVAAYLRRHTEYEDLVK
jgi:predicted GNAT family acetyltransferase